MLLSFFTVVFQSYTKAVRERLKASESYSSAFFMLFLLITG